MSQICPHEDIFECTSSRSLNRDFMLILPEYSRELPKHQAKRQFVLFNDLFQQLDEEQRNSDPEAPNSWLNDAGYGMRMDALNLCIHVYPS